MTIRCSLACTLFWPCVCRNIVLGRQQELLATRSALTTRVLCEALQLQESLVITVRRWSSVCTLLCSCAWRRFLNFAHRRWQEFFAGKEFRQQGRCVLLHNLLESLMFTFSCRSSYLPELLAGREFWLQGCVHLHSWQERTEIVSRFLSFVRLCLWEAQSRASRAFLL